MKLRNKSYRIVRRAGQQGSRPPGFDQPGVEKSATVSNTSPKQSLHGHYDGLTPNPGHTGSPSTTS